MKLLVAAGVGVGVGEGVVTGVGVGVAAGGWAELVLLTPPHPARIIAIAADETSNRDLAFMDTPLPEPSCNFHRPQQGDSRTHIQYRCPELLACRMARFGGNLNHLR